MASSTMATWSLMKVAPAGLIKPTPDPVFKRGGLIKEFLAVKRLGINAPTRLVKVRVKNWRRWYFFIRCRLN